MELKHVRVFNDEWDEDYFKLYLMELKPLRTSFISLALLSFKLYLMELKLSMAHISKRYFFFKLYLMELKLAVIRCFTINNYTLNCTLWN